MHVLNAHSVVNSTQIRKRPVGITDAWECALRPVCILAPQVVSVDVLIILRKIKGIIKQELVVDALLAVR